MVTNSSGRSLTDDTRVAILGGEGMLGTDLAKICRQRGFDVKIFDLPEFDITDSWQLKQVVEAAELIVNCAAYTNVDGAESEAELAYQVNAEAVGQLGAIAKDLGKWVLHISTDFVFDGRLDRPYVETDPANPINTYGRTKLAGEQLLSDSGCKYCIIRVEWTYGSAGNNFVAKLIQRAKDTKTLKVVDDQFGSPTATTEVAKVISGFLLKMPEGIFHFASAGYVSRYEMAKFIFDRVAMDVKLLPCKTSDFLSPPFAKATGGRPAARPLNSRFDCSKISALLDEPIRPWQEPLEGFLRKL